MNTNGHIAAEAVNQLAQLESVLFVASGPVSTGRLAAALEVGQREIETLLLDLEATYADRGLALMRMPDSTVQLITTPENSETIERFLGLESVTRLSQAALEVLAIIAYMQPVTRPTVDDIRGVNSDGSLRTLLAKGLIEEVGRLDTPGRPILYGTTSTFMQHFGLASLDQLPALPDDEEE